MKYYKIEYFNFLFKMWINHDFKKYSSLQTAKKAVESYKEHKLGIKFRIQKIEIIK